MRKNCPSVNKNFFQVTEVEKGHQGKVFEAEAEGQGLEMFPRCPFSTKVTWKKILFTRGLFFQTNLLGQLWQQIAFLHTCLHFVWTWRSCQNARKKKNQLEKKIWQEKNLVKWKSVWKNFFSVPRLEKKFSKQVMSHTHLEKFFQVSHFKTNFFPLRDRSKIMPFLKSQQKA